ncbi:MAG: hypothetical protein EPN70_24815 [Paraburkholderia sp.]|uniref:hypothetical protein n=1 Tax=Paraburkholderia sp. TaxID=1926495 RepID=UPI001226D05E|nr:hypothetical protein [Paraburkholderia sp.]TAL99593.1 MAG: hypothetical protein EPN70_24815 [Paraburkholderia sp.]TAM28246.1 MAG: hypothetical protein EPN59_16210 [Paraburkholderia sp.]
MLPGIDSVTRRRSRARPSCSARSFRKNALQLPVGKPVDLPHKNVAVIGSALFAFSLMRFRKTLSQMA